MHVWQPQCARRVALINQPYLIFIRTFASMLHNTLMRLSEFERVQLKKAVLEIAGDRALVRLFGSRVDDARRGGDIDLLVELAEPLDRAENPAWMTARIIARAQTYIGERRIDVVLRDPASLELPIHQIARDSGVLL